MKAFHALWLGTLCSTTAIAMAACGATAADTTATSKPDAATPDASGDDDSGGTTFPASHSALPTVVTSNGPVLATPKVVPVFFPGFEYRAQILDYASKIGKSAYWKAVGAEYGVGALTALDPIDVVDAPDAIISDDDIQAWLASRFDGTHPEFGTAPIDGAIYTFFYPSTTTIYLGPIPVSTDGGAPEGGAGDGGTHAPRGQASCKSFGGYHQDTPVNGAHASYAVIPTCATFGPLSGLDVVTGTPSHEWIEAATDPFPISKPAYSTVDGAHLSWTFALGAGEVADMCAQYDGSFYKDAEIGYTVQRSWSNAAALAGSEPCVPAPASEPPYFNAAPVLKDDVSLSFGTTKGVTIPVGQTKTVELDLFSSAPTSGAFTVEVSGGGNATTTPALTITQDKTGGVNGDKIMVTIKSDTAASSRTGGTTFVITSTLGTEKHYWAGVVGN